MGDDRGMREQKSDPGRVDAIAGDTNVKDLVKAARPSEQQSSERSKAHEPVGNAAEAQLNVVKLRKAAEEWLEELTLEAAVDNAPPGQDTTMMDPSLRKD